MAGTVDKYIAEQDPDKRPLLEKLRGLVERAVPDATPSLKWGVPVYARNGRNVCSLAAFKDFVGLNLFAPPAALVDPGKRLEGAGKTSRMLKVRTAKEIDASSVTRWVRAAAAR